MSESTTFANKSAVATHAVRKINFNFGNQKLAKNLHKSIIEKFKARKIGSNEYFTI